MYISAAIAFGIAVVAVAVLYAAQISQKSPLYFILGLTAVVGVIMGITTIIFTKKAMYLADGNQRLECRSFFFNTTQNVLTEAIASRNANQLRSLMNNNDSGLRLDVLSSADRSVARYRIYKYIPFEYQPISEIVDIDDATLRVLVEL